MSQSRRKTPITSITTASSDKAFKTAEHRRERRAAKVAASQLDEGPGAKAFGNPWASRKDGKSWFDPGKHPDLMRK